MKPHFTRVGTTCHGELTPLGLGKDMIAQFTDILGCTEGVFLIKCVGVPLPYDRLRREDIQAIVDKIIKVMASWRGKLLSYSTRLTLILHLPFGVSLKGIGNSTWLTGI